MLCAMRHNGSPPDTRKREHDMTSIQQDAATEVAVYIGRFQVFHNAQLALLRRALAAAPQCVVVLGSAFQARSPRHPFTWEERAAMIRAALTAEEQERLQFLPVRDCYDAARWAAAVKRGVAALHPAARSVRLVGHLKDETSGYLRDFPEWRLDAAERQGDISGTALRDAYFQAAADGSVAVALSALVGQAPASTLQFLRAWASLPAYARLADEWETLRREKAMWNGSPYPPVFVTVDCVIQCAGQVLLIERGRAPGKGLLALPGGFLEPHETVWHSALRELEEETGLRLPDSEIEAAFKAVRVFDHPERSQRGRVLTHAHWFDLGERTPPRVNGADDAAAAHWTPIADIAAMEDRLHDDHFHILDTFLGLTRDTAAEAAR
jgi:bifunctional NMN adenylyltransferase/nudix hydrolase